MNLQIHRVLNDITGLRILDAILAGNRNPVALLCHSRVKSSQDTVAKALAGDYREEHVFALKQSLASFRRKIHFSEGGTREKEECRKKEETRRG
jgi:transposase